MVSYVFMPKNTFHSDIKTPKGHRKTHRKRAALPSYIEEICPPSAVHCGNKKVRSVGLQIFVCTVREQGQAVASEPWGAVALCGRGGLLSVCLCSTWRDTKAEAVTLRVLTALFNQYPAVPPQTHTPPHAIKNRAVFLDPRVFVSTSMTPRLCRPLTLKY